MNGAVGSALEKPLSELTEEDIAQITREDCRRFLKLKGMRRPSWNKSQAIQQVISLKALLEDRPNHQKVRLINHPPMSPPPKVSVPWTTRAVEDLSPYRRKDPDPMPTHTLLTCAPRGHRYAGVQRDEAAQMTIFYGGNVAVYNGVAADRAHAIMQLAASPIDLNKPPTEPVLASPTVHSQINSSACGGPSTSPIGSGPPEWTHAGESDDSLGGFGECPAGRQASLQRYREKRKDRYKGKRIIGGSPSSMEMMLLGQKFGSQTPTEQSSLSNTSSPTQLRVPCTPTWCSSIENHAQKFCISIDLNNDGCGE